MICITSFLENINHEMPDYTDLVVNRQAYKVDGEAGIKVFCENTELKSVDYFDSDTVKGFQYIEFSNLLAHDDYIKQKISTVRDAKDLPKKLNSQIRKEYTKLIHQELIQKLKDSKTIRDELPSYLQNIPSNFQTAGRFVIVIAPIKEEKRVEAARLVEYWVSSIKQSIPKKWLTDVVVIPLDILCNQIQKELDDIQSKSIELV